ncbi:MAG: TonB-dependent receptor [Sneathiellaceae bacterium]
MTRSTCLPALRLRLRAAAAGLLAATALPAAAQDQAQTYRLDTLVVTPTRTPTPISEVGSAVSVITADELQDRQIDRLENALNTVPGVRANTDGAQGVPTPVRIRGLGPRNTLVLVDGVEVANPARSQVAYEFGNIPVGAVSQIEVLRGPQSALYGADASGGVINITTREPTRPFEARGVVEAGSYGLVRTDAGMGALQGPVSLSANASTFRTRGYSSFSDKRGGSEADDYHSKSFQAKGRVAVSDRVSAFANGRWVWERTPTDTSTADLLDSYIQKQEQYYRAGGDIALLDGRLLTTLAANYTWHHRTFVREALDGDTYDGFKTKLEARSAYRLNDAVTLVGGLESEEERLQQRALNAGAGLPALGNIDASVRTNSAYGEVQVRPLRDLTLTLGSRYDDNQQFGSVATWRGTAAWFVPDWGSKFRTSYGTGFVAPSLYELNDPCIGFADLQPEKSTGFDVGLDQVVLDDRLDFSLTLFRTDLRDQIAYGSFRTLSAACTPFFGTTGGYGNRDKVRSEGVELSFFAQPVDGLTLQGSYTYDRANDLSNNRALPDVPAHMASLDLDYRLTRDLRVGGSALYQSTQRGRVGNSDAFTVLGLRAEYAVRENVSLFGRIDNLLNRQYEEIAGFGTPDRSVYGGLRASF